MKASYTPSLTHSKNPFVEALPPMLEGQELLDALGYYPAYSEEMRMLSAAERLQLLGNLYEVYQPVEMTIQLYYQVYSAMVE